MDSYLIILSSLLLPCTAFSKDDFGVRFIGEYYPQWSRASDMEIADNIMFVCNSRFDILDFSDPANPEYLYFSSLLGNSSYVEVVGGTAYLAFSNELRLFDVSDLTNPVSLGSYVEEGNFIRDLIVHDNIAFLQTRHNIMLLDVSDPEAIQRLSTIDSTANLFELDVGGQYLYAFQNGEGLRVFDISAPNESQQVGWFPFEVVVNDLFSSNRGLFVASESIGNQGITVLDVTNVRDISRVTFMEIGNREPNSVSVVDSLMFIEFQGQLVQYNIANIENPIQMRSTNTSGLFVTNDSLLFVQEYTEPYYLEVDVFNFRGPNGLVPVGGVVDPTRIDRVKLSGENLLINGALFDIADPESPALIGQFPTDGQLPRFSDADFEINEPYLHLYERGEYAIYDITDPSRPELCSDYDVDSDPHRIEIELNGDYSYVATSDGYLVTLDVSDPNSIGVADLVLLSEEGISYSEELILRGDRLYYLSTFNVIILDVSNPAEPFIITNYSDLHWISSLALYETYLYIGTEKGLSILDISNEEQPTLIGTIDIPIGYMTISGNHLVSGWALSYEGDSERLFGVQILSLENPEFPRLVGYFDTSGWPWRVAVRDNLLYVADDYSLVILDCSEALSIRGSLSPISYPSALSLFSYPNPFNSSTTISYSLPKPGRYALSVVDITGREVARLSDGWKNAGSYREIWNPTTVASGSYKVILQNELELRIQPITLIK